MWWPANQRAPDDQVLDFLLSKGEWLRRASFGWLPAAYLRTMPSFYRGVVPVIDHDHGSAPGLMNHSEAKPKLPPVRDLRAPSPFLCAALCPLRFCDACALAGEVHAAAQCERPGE